MRKVSTLLLTVGLLFTNIGQAFAVPLSDIRVGDRYYLYRLLGSNVVVQVTQVDRTNGAVRVQHPGGAMKWVRPKDLLTRFESEAADAATNVGVAIGVLGILVCASNPEACKKK